MSCVYRCQFYDASSLHYICVKYCSQYLILFNHRYVWECPRNMCLWTIAYPTPNLSYRHELFQLQVYIGKYSFIYLLVLVVISFLDSMNFTQMIWKSSNEMGIGISKVKGQNKYVIVAHYKPSGNINTPGEFRKNVLPPNS